MLILKQTVAAGDILNMIQRRLDNVTMQYNHARANGSKITAEAMAETKWQLAELKMQFVDLLAEQLEAAE